MRPSASVDVGIACSNYYLVSLERAPSTKRSPYNTTDFRAGGGASRQDEHRARRSWCERCALGSSGWRRVADAVISRAVVLDDVELNSIKDRVITDGSRVSGTFTERLSIRFARSAQVITADRIERDQVDRVDLNVDLSDRIDASNSNLWPLPKAKGDGDAACDYLGA